MTWSRRLSAVVVVLAASSCPTPLPLQPECILGTTWCGGERCVDLLLDPAHCGECNRACADGLVCSSGACGLVCGGGTLECGEFCVNARQDPGHCGDCTTICATGQVCASGTCAVSCGLGLSQCASPQGGVQCVDTAVDGRNCGGCGVRCASGWVCASGQCVLSCQQGLTACGEADGGRQCLNTSTDRDHCGGCHQPCAEGTVCSDGRCEATCAAPTTLCRPGVRLEDGGIADAGTPFCANLDSDNRHCGGCETTCATGTVCVGGKCGVVCGGQQSLCTGDGGTWCTNLQTDTQNCGACEGSCDAGLVCSGGACSVTCGGGLTRCISRNGTPYCANLTVDGQNCGACERACGAAARCIAGQCTAAGPTCAPHQGLCHADAGDFCANLATDNANCGTCDRVCGLGSSCVGGMCQTSGGGDGGSVGCAPFQTACLLPDGTPYCASLQSDNQSCGQCGVVCAGGTSCVAGVCGGVTCGLGQSLCQRPAGGSFCASLEFDPQNCGGCNHACPPASPYCSGSTCVAQNYGPGGVQVDVVTANLPSTWSQCFVERYTSGTTAIGSIQAQCNKDKLLMACRPLGSPNLKVAAWAPRADVFFDTGNLNVPHVANGVGWYFDPLSGAVRSSWGFAPAGATVLRQACDVRDSSRDATGGEGNKRLCWETSNGLVNGGWRCGKADDLHLTAGNAWERVVFHAD